MSKKENQCHRPLFGNAMPQIEYVRTNVLTVSKIRIWETEESHNYC